MATSEQATDMELDREKKQLEIEELRERIAVYKRPFWQRTNIETVLPLLLGACVFVWQVWDSNRKYTADQRKIEAEQRRAEKSESNESGLKVSIDALAVRLAALSNTLVSAGGQGTPLPTTIQSAMDSQLEQEAQANIRWIILEDKGARNTYEKAKAGNGGNKFLAAVYAQAHNPHAQSVLRQYGEQKVVAYITSLGG